MIPSIIKKERIRKKNVYLDFNVVGLIHIKAIWYKDKKKK